MLLILPLGAKRIKFEFIPTTWCLGKYETVNQSLINITTKCDSFHSPAILAMYLYFLVHRGVAQETFFLNYYFICYDARFYFNLAFHYAYLSTKLSFHGTKTTMYLIHFKIKGIPPLFLWFGLFRVFHNNIFLQTPQRSCSAAKLFAAKLIQRQANILWHRAISKNACIAVCIFCHQENSGKIC